MSVAVTIVSSIISGVLATVITLYINHRSEQIRVKKDLVDDIFGYRYQISNNYNGNKAEINRALNRIPIVFNKHKEVLQAYDKLYECTILETNTKEKVIDDALVTLYKAMCMAAKIEVKEWNDSRIKNVLKVL